MDKVTVIGIGPGSSDFLTLRAKTCIAQAELIFAAKRHAELAPPEKRCALEPLSDAMQLIERHWREGRRLAVLVSGDPGLYSLLPMLKRTLGAENINVIPGVSALQTLYGELGESWQEACVLSGHGRALSETALLYSVERHFSTAVFCDQAHNPRWIGEALFRGGLKGVRVAVGERLGYEDQRLTEGSPSQICAGSYDALSMVRIENPDWFSALPLSDIPDEDFIRGKTPMTKRQIRALIISALHMKPDAVVWDVGAGTGSVSVACGLHCPFGTVYAVEHDESACELIRQNAELFHTWNVKIVQGQAPDALAALPQPTHVFLGGTDGKMAEIIQLLEDFSAPVRLAATAVTLESAGQLAALLKPWAQVSMAQIAVNQLEPVGRYHLFRAQNPVFLISADWKGIRT